MYFPKKRKNNEKIISKLFSNPSFPPTWSTLTVQLCPIEI